jgi:glycosyltransferase involved in cell wall biosynthesis
MADEPKVSVCMITYAQEAYVAEAIESVLAQDVDFAVELVIGEDCSPDRTGDIVESYAHKYPGTIRLFRRDRNIGMMRNLIRTLGDCRGTYIAFLEGDDYWCDRQKLKKQVKILDHDPSLSMVFTSMWMLKDGTKTLANWAHDKRSRYTLDDLLRGSLGYTLTFMYRRIYCDGYPAWVIRAKMGDWTLHTLQALHGDAWYFNEPTAVYRVHGGGVWSGKSRIAQCCMDEATNQMLIRNLPAWVPRENLRARLRQTRQDIVYYGLVYGGGLWHGLRGFLLSVLGGTWPFAKPTDVVRAISALVPGLRNICRCFRSCR